MKLSGGNEFETFSHKISLHILTLTKSINANLQENFVSAQVYVAWWLSVMRDIVAWPGFIAIVSKIA